MVSFGEHRLFGKYNIYEEALRVSLVMRFPQLISEPMVSEDLIANIDIAPTIAELVEATPTLEVNGMSLVSLFNEEEWRGEILLEQKRKFGRTQILPQ